MALKVYSVTLDEKIVERALKISKKYGGKFSPLLNQIILEWCEQEENNKK
jgi:hypothetical protein